MEAEREFTFAFQGADSQKHPASGQLDQSLLSALRSSSNVFTEEEGKNEGKGVCLVEREQLRGALNPGMPCRCLAGAAHLEVTFCGMAPPPVREEAAGGRECVTFSVAAAPGQKPIVKGHGPSEAGLDLCVYAFGGESAGEALRKDGRFLPELDGQGWKLVERQTLEAFPPAHPVEQLSRRAFELRFDQPAGGPEPGSEESAALRGLAEELGDYLKEGGRAGAAPWDAAKREFEELTGGSVPNRVPSDIAKLPVGMNEAVGTISWSRGAGNEGSAACFHLAKGYVLTCYHVVKMMVGDGVPESEWGQAVRSSASVSFVYKTATRTQWKVMDNGLRAYSAELDYAVLGLEIPEGRAPELRLGLAPWATKPIPRGVVYTVGQQFTDSLMLVPLGQETEDLSSRQCFQAFSVQTFARLQRPERVAYDAEFLHDPAASGSPVFSYYGGMLGMHAGGYLYEDHVIEFGPTIQAIAFDINLHDRPFYQLLFHANSSRKDCVVM